MAQQVTLEQVLCHLRRRNFAVLSTCDEEARPASAGVTYGVSDSRVVIYVMTRRHLQKARNIAANPAVALVIPLTRRLLWFVPSATIQLRGHAELLDSTDAEGRRAFGQFWVGRRILKGYEHWQRRGKRGSVLSESHRIR